MREDIVNNLIWEYIRAARKMSMKRECLEIQKWSRGLQEDKHPRKASCLEERLESENLPEEIS